jgi:hypothetical protein
MDWVLVLVVAWLALAAPAAVLIGGALKVADRRARTRGAVERVGHDPAAPPDDAPGPHPGGW